MQVYIAICDIDDDYLIGKKREFNNWWKLDGTAQQGGEPALVNQAGQWCFPGGRLEKKDTSFIVAAKREFEEETGYDVPATLSEAVVIQNSNYALVHCKVKTMTDLMYLVSEGVKPNTSNSMAPRNIQVEDWELSELVIVPKAQLCNYLGVQNPVSTAVTAALPHAKPYSQAIDWYRDMAIYIMTH